MTANRNEETLLRSRMSRRQFLAGAVVGTVGAGIGGFLLSGCSGQQAAPTAAPAAKAPAAPAAPAAKTPVTIKMAHSGMSADDAHTVAAEKWAELMKQRSNGAVDVQVFGAMQLGDEQAQMKMARLGAPAVMGSAAINNLEPFAPSVGFFVLPYMFASRKQLQAVVDQAWDDINAKVTKEAGVRIVAWFDYGFRHLFNSKREIKSIADLKGLKMRVPQNNIMMETYTAWGQPPITMAWSETYTGLQQKVIDGGDVPYVTAIANKWPEVTPFGTPLHYNCLSGVVVMGEQFYQGLPPDVQKLVMECGKDATAHEFKWIDAEEPKYKNVLAGQGIKFTDLTDEPEWEKRAKGIWPKYLEKYDKALMDKVESAKKSAG